MFVQRCKHSSNKAFTFIELLVVLLIISLLYTGTFAELGKYIWVLEIALSIFWTIMLFFLFRRIIWDCTRRRNILWKIKPLVISLFVLHLAVSLVLRFQYNQSIFLVFPITFLVGVLLPIVFYPLLVTLYEKFREAPRFSSNEIQTMAMQSSKAQEFIGRYPNYSLYVYEHSRNDRIGTCLLQYRCSRIERDDLYEDRLLEILIDLKKQKPVEGKEHLIHYIFQPYQRGSIVMELQETALSETVSLDEETLTRFDQTMNSFPSLDHFPLPIAIRKISFETLVSAE